MLTGKGHQPPSIDTNIGKLVPAYCVLIVHVLLGIALALTASLLIFPPVAPFAVLAIALCGIKVARKFNPLVLHVSLLVAVLIAFQQGALTPVVIIVAVVAVALLRTTSLLQLSKNAQYFEGALLITEAKRFLLISIVVTAVGVIAANVGTFGSGAVALIALVVSAIALITLLIRGSRINGSQADR